MLLNYLKLSLRLLARNPFFTFINVAGLSIGFAVFFVLWQYSTSELQTDKMWKDSDRVVRLLFSFEGQGTEFVSSRYPPAAAGIMAESLPELSEYVRICIQEDFRKTFALDHDKKIFLTNYLPNGQKISFQESKLIYADHNLFTFFSIDMVWGSPEQVLLNPESIILSEKLSQKYFGSTNPIGKILVLNDTLTFTVTGVYKNLPVNSHLEFEGAMSIKRIEDQILSIDFTKDDWFNTYFKLPVGVNLVNLQKKMDSTSRALLKKEIVRWFGETTYLTLKIELQPLTEIAFNAVMHDSFKQKSKSLLSNFQWIALLILALGWINYINLSISAHRKRTKEIAARQTLGAGTKHLITQFIIEATLINCLSILIAFTLFQLFKTPMEYFFDFGIARQGTSVVPSALWISVMVSGGIVISGLYPAFIVINKSPRSLFASLRLHSSENQIARALTVLQFVAAIALIVWAFTVNSQMNFIMLKDLGFAKDHVVIVDLPYAQRKTFSADLKYFSEEVNTILGVSDYSWSSSVPGDRDYNGIGLQRNIASEFIGVATNGGINERFIPFYGIKVLSGRNFADNPADENSVILSRKAAERLGLTPEAAIGTQVLVEREAWTHEMHPREVIGVIEDYSHQPLLNRFQGSWSNDAGMALTLGNKADAENEPFKFSIKIEGENFDSTLDKIGELYSISFHGNLFNWTFLDDNVNRHYENEMVAGNQILLFTSIAIGIACLGLLGMISNKVVEKTKEIGIRKVLGAELHQIAQILLNTTVKQLIIATAVGIPVAYYLTQQYLEKYSERITLQWWHFALPIVILILIMLVTVASVLYKAARSNPVEALKYE